MQAAIDYRAMARQCIREAEEIKDLDRKKTLLGIAKLYNQTALAQEAAEAAPICQTTQAAAQTL